MNRKKYDVDYADDVNMWEIVRYDDELKEWECMGVYAKEKGTAQALADMFGQNNK